MSGEEAHDETRRAVLDAWWQREPLAFEIRDEGAARERFEFSSRGDRVEGWLQRPGPEEAPLVLAIPGSRSGSADPVAAAWAKRWVAGGAAVACLDLPLHGARESAKLSDALVEAASDPRALAADGDRRRLVDEFLLQCRSDLLRALTGLGERPGIDAARSVCVGSGLGALACLHGGAEAQLRGVVLVDAPAGYSDRGQLDCPVLGIGCGGAPALAGAAETLAVDAPDAAADAAWPFVARALGL